MPKRYRAIEDQPAFVFLEQVKDLVEGTLKSDNPMSVSPKRLAPVASDKSRALKSTGGLNDS